MRRRRLLTVTALAASTAIVAAGCAAAGPAAPPPADATTPMTDTEQARVLEALADALDRRFVFPDVGRRYASVLRMGLGAGTWAALRDPAAFAAAVTDALQAVHRDGHLRLRVRTRDAGASPGPTRMGGLSASLAPIARAEMVGEVAVLAFNFFPEDADVARDVRAFLTGPASGAKALVIDARAHRGGGLRVMDALLALIYAQPRTLVRMDTRRGAFGSEEGPAGRTLRRREAPDALVRSDHVVEPDAEHRALQSVPVMYLVSGRTASAAEHLALALQVSGRATLVGETTRGAGHYGAEEDFGRFSAFVPVGRTYDPVTGRDWEGRGIAPDVAVPAAQAMDRALALLAAQGIRTTD